MKLSRATPSQLLVVLLACEMTIVRCSSGPVGVIDSIVACAALLLLAWMSDHLGEKGHWLVGVVWGLSLFGIVLHPLHGVSESMMFWALVVLPTITTVLWLTAPEFVQRYGVVPITFGATAVLSWQVDEVVGFQLTLFSAMLLMTLVSVVVFRAKTATWRILFVLFTVLVSVATPDFASSDVSENTSDKPDILLVTVDTLRAKSAQHMVSFQQVAEEGCDFTHALAPAPWTLPSMATIHTGVLPAVHGAKGTALSGFQAIHEDVPTLAEDLRAAGYQTAAVLAANPFVGESFGFSRGFDRDYHGRDGRNLGVPRGQYKGSLGRLNLARLATIFSVVPEPGYDDAAALVARATQEIARADSQPLFLWVHLLDTHLPYTHAMKAEGSWMARVGLSKLNRRGLLSNVKWREEPGRKLLEVGYENEVREVDSALTSLLLAYRGRGQNNITVMTADHGEELLEHGGLEHGHTLHRELLHVPLVISGLEACDSVESQATSLSIIKPLVLGTLAVEERRRPKEMSHSLGHESGDLLYPTESGHVSSLLVGRWKFIHTNGVPILYDLASDIDEQFNVASDYPAVVTAMNEQLSTSKTDAGRVDLTAEERGMLEVLGYLENQFPNK